MSREMLGAIKEFVCDAGWLIVLDIFLCLLFGDLTLLAILIILGSK